MTHRIAADEVEGPCGLADGVVEIENDLGIRFRPVVKMPTLSGQPVLHIETPAAKKVIGRIVMFHQFESPSPVRANDLADPVCILGNGGVDIALFRIRGFAFAQRNETAGLVLSVSEEGAGPKSGSHAQV